MHGAADVHPQTVGHAGAAVVGAGAPTVAGWPRIVTWQKSQTKASAIEKVTHEHLRSRLNLIDSLQKMTQNGCCEPL